MIKQEVKQIVTLGLCQSIDLLCEPSIDEQALPASDRIGPDYGMYSTEMLSDVLW